MGRKSGNNITSKDSKDGSAARGRQAPAAAEAPHGSTSRMALLAVLSALCPLAPLLPTAAAGLLAAASGGHSSGGSSDADHPAARRLDALLRCTAGGFAGPDSAGYEDAARASTWAAIRSTSLISLSVGALCLALFEAYRRDPIVRRYVYDRKRDAAGGGRGRVGRVPPPLMLSRSLWTGGGGDGEGDGGPAGSGCPPRLGLRLPRVRPALLEIVFMTLDGGYLRYARAADRARRARESSGRRACCASGRYHDNCRNRIDRSAGPGAGPEQGDGEDGAYVDGDGYVLRPGHPQSRRGRATSGMDGGRDGAGTTGSLTRNGSVRVLGGLFDEETALAPLATRWRRNVEDLFPEDDEDEEGRRDEGGDGGEQDGSSGPTASRKGAADCSTAELGERGRVASLSEVGSSLGGASEGSNVTKDASKAGGGEEEARRLGAEEARRSGAVDDDKAGAATGPDETDPEAAASGQSLLSVEVPAWADVGSNGDEDDDAAEADDDVGELKYPSRLVSLCLPPGFHSWGTAVAYLASFLFLDKFFSGRWRPGGGGSGDESGGESGDEDGHDGFLRRLTRPGQGLSDGDAELLRCAGLDTFLLIRLARFGFDVTFYPFATACVAVLPIYWTSPTASATDYLSITINSLPDGAEGWRLNLVCVFTMCLYLYVLRRLWVEWEVFIKLRYGYLMNGDGSFDQRPTYLRKFRNSVMVECVPPGYRSDRNLRDVFENLFPGRIRHAEMLIDTTKLEGLLERRRGFIDKYDDADARYEYEKWRYRRQQEGCCGRQLAEPQEPEVRRRTGCSRGEPEPALEYYRERIREADEAADAEFDAIVDRRQTFRNRSLLGPINLSPSSSQMNVTGPPTPRDLYNLFIPSKLRRLIANDEAEFFTGTGLVEFTSLSEKQFAIQGNLSGQPYFMLASNAPDPRDLLWCNISMDRKTIEQRRVVVQLVLIVGLLGWGTVVTVITNFANNLVRQIESANLLDDSIPASVLYGYLPTTLISLILLYLPSIFFELGKRVIRFKSLSRVDEFTLLWNTCYRLTNIFFTFFSASLIQAVQCFREDPNSFVKAFAAGILRQSSFLMNLMIVATGQETMLQLLQWRSLIKQGLFRPLQNLNAKSSRYIDWLNQCPPFEQGFLFGFYAPSLSYGLIIAILYSFLAPIMLGVGACFFWTANKVHTHNALFVYCQNCEGGGKLFYYWSRIVFVALYSSTVVFSGVLLLKKFKGGIAFFFLATLLVYFVDKMIQNTFVVHSLNLPMSVARIHDQEEDERAQASHLDTSRNANYMYRQPELNHVNWDTSEALQQ